MLILYMQLLSVFQKFIRYMTEKGLPVSDSPLPSKDRAYKIVSFIENFCNSLFAIIKYLLAAVKYADVLVDGRFEEELKDVNYHWAGSTNQRVIDVQKSLQKGEVVLHESN